MLIRQATLTADQKLMKQQEEVKFIFDSIDS